MICALELERQERAKAGDRYLLGEWPFEIGMWVARQPRPTSSVDQTIRSELHPRAAHQVESGQTRSPIPIETLSWCNRPLTPKAFISCSKEAGSLGDLLPRTPATRGQDRNTPTWDLARSTAHTSWLAVDEQIYRRLPCFLISTIDKFAALPWVGKTSSLFGNVSHYQLPNWYGVAGFGPC